MNKKSAKPSVNFFDAFSDTYNEVRPAYNEEVYTAIAAFLTPGPVCKILEIGAGNGIASEKIHEIWKPDLTLVEPGKKLSLLLREKFKHKTNVQIITDSFENVTLENASFDAVVAATSFHWVDSGIKFAKSHRLLKENGLLIVFWNNYLINDADCSEEIQRVYYRYTGKISEKNIRELQAEKIENRKNEIATHPLFRLVDHQIFTSEIPFTSAEYLKLLKTFPDHAAFSTSFFEEIAAIIEKYGAVTVKITLNLNIAAKR